MGSDNPSYALDVNPEASLNFVLTRNDASNAGSDSDGIPRCTMTLTHPGKTTEPLAFKVKTTQPRRYLVRPNQGVITSGSSETIALILVEKDKQSLLQSYDRLGQSALDHSKDKFLVQSCAVSSDFAAQFTDKALNDENLSKSGKELTDALTSMWNQAVASSDIPIYNKKLHVKHIVGDLLKSSTLGQDPHSSSSATLQSPPLQKMEKTPMEGMTHEQMLSEVSSLRRKYDELVAFSVNLTAERDILNNTLEQTKRDLSREMTARNSLENNGGKEMIKQRQSNEGKGFSMSLIQMLVVAIACFIGGIKAGNHSVVTDVIEEIPIIASVLGADAN